MLIHQNDFSGNPKIVKLLLFNASGQSNTITGNGIDSDNKTIIKGK